MEKLYNVKFITIQCPPTFLIKKKYKIHSYKSIVRDTEST